MDRQLKLKKRAAKKSLVSVQSQTEKTVRKVAHNHKAVGTIGGKNRKITCMGAKSGQFYQR